MKKKLITLIICGVIGGTSIVGVAMYKMSEGADETQTLVNAHESEEVNANEENSLEESKEDTELKDETTNENGGQASRNLPANSNANQSEGTSSNSVNGGQGTLNNSEQPNDEGTSDEEKEEVNNGNTNNDLNNNGGNQNGGNSNDVVTPPAEDTGSFFDQVEQLIFNKVNEERANAGLPALSYNSTMETYARIKSKDMGVRNYFDHVNPEGEMITAQMARDGVSYNAWGENIAYIGGVDDATALANQFMTNWMNSSGHKANILSTNFTSIGVGVYKSGNRYYATQEFYK